MLANFNPIFDAVLVCSVGLVVVRVSFIFFTLVQCIGENKVKK